MIISYTNNFVVVRVPRAAGTSLAFYFFKSGLIDPKKDLYKIEGSFPSWQDFDEYIANEGLSFKTLPKDLYSLESLEGVRRPFFDLAEKGAVLPDMPCVASIRKPTERFASIFAYACEDSKRFIATQNGEVGDGIKTMLGAEFPDKDADINMLWDFAMETYFTGTAKNLFHQQCHFFPDHAEVFNIENIHDHASKFISERGGVVADPIELRKNPDIFTPDQTETILSKLTPDRRQALEDTFAKDFELWEKAYAVYN